MFLTVSFFIGKNIYCLENGLFNFSAKSLWRFIFISLSSWARGL